MAVGGASGGGMGKAIEAGRAFVRLGADDGPLRSTLNSAKKLVIGWGASFAAGGAGLIALGGSVLAPIAAAFKSMTEEFDQFSKASDRTGATTEALSALTYAAKQSDASLEDVSNGAKFLQKNISEAGKGTEEAVTALQEVGLTADQLKGKGLDEQFLLVADALDKIADPADRTNAALKLLGRGGLALVPMFKGGAAALEELLDEAHKVGAVVSGEDAKNATRAGDAISRAWTAAKNALLAVGAALLPQIDRIEEFTWGVVRAAKTIKDFIDQNRNLVLAVTAGAASLVAAGAAFVGIGTALAVAGVAIGGIATAFTAAAAVVSTLWAWAPVIAVVGGLAAAVAGLGYVLYQFTPVGNAVDAAITKVGQTFQWVSGVVQTAWSGISAALSNRDWEGALAIAGAALDVLWAGMKLAATKAWNYVKELALDAWDDITGAGAKMITDIRAELRIFGTDMSGYLIDTFFKIWNGFSDAAKAGLAVAMAMSVEFANQSMALAKRVALYGVKVAKDPGAMLESMVNTAPIMMIINAGTEEAAKGKVMADAMGVDAAQEAIRVERDKLKADIDILTEKKKEARHAADRAEEARLGVELEKKENELRGLTNAQLVRQANDAMMDKFLRDMMAAAGGKADAIKASVAGGTRGQFGGRNVAQQFSAGAASTQEKIEKNTKRAADGIDEVKDKVGDLRGW